MNPTQWVNEMQLKVKTKMLIVELKSDTLVIISIPGNTLIHACLQHSNIAHAFCNMTAILHHALDLLQSTVMSTAIIPLFKSCLNNLWFVDKSYIDRGCLGVTLVEPHAKNFLSSENIAVVVTVTQCLQPRTLLMSTIMDICMFTALLLLLLLLLLSSQCASCKA